MVAAPGSVCCLAVVAAALLLAAVVAAALLGAGLACQVVVVAAALCVPLCSALVVVAAALLANMPLAAALLLAGSFSAVSRHEPPYKAEISPQLGLKECSLFSVGTVGKNVEDMIAILHNMNKFGMLIVILRCAQ